MTQNVSQTRILSLGAGVQSSCLALMIAYGELAPIAAAVFADTQAEPRSVYNWLDTLEALVNAGPQPFPIRRVTAGSLGDNELRVRRSAKSGRLYMSAKIPAYIKKPDGKAGLMGRRCTSDYKIVPIQREVKKILGIARATKNTPKVAMLIGISIDEAHRMKPSQVRYIENTWPLIDLEMTREQCLEWIEAKGFPVPPRSACRFCPFHSDEEWLRLKTEEPEDWAEVVQFEKKLQAAAASQEVLTGVPYLHESLVPIDQVKFASGPGHRQVDLFGNECEGLCGV